VIDLSSGSVQRLDSHEVVEADGGKNFTVSSDGKSILSFVHSGALTRIIRFPVSGREASTQLLTVTGTVWFLEAGPGDSFYANMVDRPIDLVRFPVDGSRTERLATFPKVPDLSTMTVLPDGRAVLPVRAFSQLRLMAVQKGKDPAPLVNTTEETAAP
jgi:hypothetical protein